MAVLPVCPSCGLQSSEMRCPRCYTLKVISCSGSCTLCKTSGTCEVPEPERPAPEVERVEAGGDASKKR